MNAFSSIEAITLQHSTRHMDKIQAQFPQAHTQKAVEAFVKLDKGVVFIYTGFTLRASPKRTGP
ncbi:MAG: hypothetical protein LRY52_01085 [Sulfurospirillum cavolei]|nr:hypothetical protein [Sulfurospirillum cavolei]